VAKSERDGWLLLSLRGTGGISLEGWVTKSERDGWLSLRGMGG
jgi:hypothetical protein